MTARPRLFVVVSDGADARRAADAARAAGATLTLLSAAGAAANGGCGWFRHLATQTAAAFPDVSPEWIIDCGDRAGDVLAALADGAPAVVFDGPATAAARLADIAAARGARLWRTRPAALILRPGGDPRAAACDWLSRFD